MTKQPTDSLSYPTQEIINQLLALYNQGRLTEAVLEAELLTKKYSTTLFIWNILGAAAAQTAQFNKAIFAFEKIISLEPNNADAHYNIGNTFKDQGDLKNAVKAYEKALELNPNFAEAYNNMGNALKDQSKTEQALEAYNKAISLKQDNEQTYNNIGIIFQEQGKLEEALKAYEKALAIKPDFAQVYNNIGVIRYEQGKFDQSLEAHERALKINPNYAEAMSNRGNVLQELGHFEEAVEFHKKAISNFSELVASHRALSNLMKYKVGNPQISEVEKLINMPGMANDDRCQLHYTYAKMKEDVEEFDVAFRHYSIGGALRKEELHYHLDQDKKKFELIKNTAPRLKEIILENSIQESKVSPIFILGMPRSGTTLVEQIISSHSMVTGAGELHLLNQFGDSSGYRDAYLNSDSILELQDSYLKELERLGQGKPFVTDKMPTNFLHIGLIMKAFPGAKIVHTKRDPAATCWSNFKHYFSGRGLGYSYNLSDTVAYYKMYKSLMSSWEQDFQGKIYHLDYDLLTVQQESQSRKLLQYLELDWENTCLSPQDNKRSVRTASQQQVRRKVYKGSSEAWKNFERLIGDTFGSLYE